MAERHAFQEIRVALRWNRQMDALRDILTISVARWVDHDDDRFATAALATYQILSGPYRIEAMNGVKEFFDEHRTYVLVNHSHDEVNCERAIVRHAKCLALIETFKQQKTGLFASWRTKRTLNLIAPELKMAIERYDKGSVVRFGDYEAAT